MGLSSVWLSRVLSVQGFLFLGFVMSRVCYVWGLLCLVFVISSVCYVQCLLHLVFVMSRVCYVWCLLCLAFFCIGFVMARVCLSRLFYVTESHKSLNFELSFEFTLRNLGKRLGVGKMIGNLLDYLMCIPQFFMAIKYDQKCHINQIALLILVYRKIQDLNFFQMYDSNLI